VYIAYGPISHSNGYISRNKTDEGDKRKNEDKEKIDCGFLSLRLLSPCLEYIVRQSDDILLPCHMQILLVEDLQFFYYTVYLYV